MKSEGLPISSVTVLRRLLEQQQHVTVKQQCLQLCDSDPTPALLPLLALAHAHLGEVEAAEEILARLNTAKPALDGDALTDLASVHFLLGRVDEAAALLASVLSEVPDHALALARLALCHLAQKDQAAAAELFRYSAASKPRVPVLLNLARLQLDEDDTETAQITVVQVRALLAELAAEWPTDLLAQFAQQCDSLQLQLWVATEQFAAAEGWLQTQQNDATHTGWLTEYAHLLAGHAHHAQAEEILRAELQARPDSVPLLMQLAELAKVQGRILPAMRLFKRAIAQDEGNIGLWVQLATACLIQAPAEARTAAEKAVELASALDEAPEQPAAWAKAQRLQAQDALAQVECQEQHYEAAETLFRAILAEAPDFVPALHGLGQLQMQTGHIDEAVALFEQVQAIDPVKGQTALINARRFPDTDEALDKLEQAARRPTLEGPVRSSILFQLAAAREKRGDYDKAFGFADEANAASRRFLNYDARAHRNQCARIRTRFSKALYEHRPGCGVDSSLPVFVLGMPRSGTTLVEQIIAGHSRIFGAGELGTIPRTVQGLNRWERHVGSGRRYPDCVDDLTPEVVNGIAGNLLKELQEYAPEAKHIVDKLPHNFEHIGLIKLLFPRARIISVRRDPRDIALSNYFTDYQAKHIGMGFAYDLTAIGEQLADHNLLMRHWQQVFPGEILEINYEDVVDDLEGSARKLLDYIGVDWEPGVLDFDKLQRPVKTASVWQVRQPIYQTSKAKWKRYENYLAPLIRGTNALIRPDPVEMLSLPEPGFLTKGIAAYHAGDLDDAELSFKKMLHHNPEHAACTFMVGLIYVRKQHLHDGIALMEKALDKLPWKRDWRDDLIQACELAGLRDRAEALRNGPTPPQPEDPDGLEADAQCATLV